MILRGGHKACVTACALAGVALFAQTDAPQYFDPPTFIPAGVTDPANRGGHGSDPVLRSAESLAQAAAALSSEHQPDATEQSLRDALAHDPGNAGLHHSLADVEEKSGRFLQALHEYQRAVEINASEPFIFDFGVELLKHRASDQAADIFTRGHRLFPRSTRILLGLAVADYFRGSLDDAAKYFFEAADLDPRDPTPYLFLGKAQSGPIGQSEGYLARMQRFVKLHPDNAWANYYCGASLRVQSQPEARALLEESVRLDAKLAPAWLELGVLYADQQEDRKAISAWQNAAAADPRLEEPHYRLAQVYRRAGETNKSRREIELYEQLKKQSTDELERERAGIKQFVFELR